MVAPSVSRSLLLKLAVALVVLGGLGILALKGLPLKAWADAVLTWLRGVGPVPFFAAMVVLPALGFPMIVFSASAGTLFSEQMTWPGVIVAVAAGLAGNLVLTYWAARRGMRPLLSRLVTRLGYRLPVVGAGDHASLTVLVRVTPGPPFFVQSYLLGLAEVRFGTYFVISWAIALVYALSFTFFGDALLHGKGKAILVGVSLLIVITVLVSWLRRRFKRAAPTAS